MALSPATVSNWARLQPELSGKLRRGANKTRSSKIIFPVEYLSDQSNFAFLQQIDQLHRKDGITPENILYTLALQQLKRHGLLAKDHVQAVLAEYSGWEPHSDISAQLPLNERDALGCAWQVMQTEGKKNRSGSYYTPADAVRHLTAGIDLSCGRTFFDPGCGSGSFFLELSAKSPEQLWGCDRDPRAIFIAKINLLCRFPDIEFSPNVFCCNYLSRNNVSDKKFDYIAANPPWGSDEKNGSKRQPDSFIRFFRQAFQQLSPGGRIAFLLPETVLTARIHREFRNELLTGTRLEKITLFSSRFSGVMTRYIALTAENGPAAKEFKLSFSGSSFPASVPEIMTDPERAIPVIAPADRALLESIEQKKFYDLSNSVFALGIVTGNNRQLLIDEEVNGSVGIGTGKEVERYFLRPARKFIFPDWSAFQQAAPESFYRTPEKLVYKFISRKLVFAYDDSGTLLLNSANLLIPQIPGLGIKTVLALLNSEVLNFYYQKRFPGLKVLKSALCRLPFPRISEETDRTLTELTGELLAGDTGKDEELQQLIFDCYQLSAGEIAQIRRFSQQSR